MVGPFMRKSLQSTFSLLGVRVNLIVTRCSQMAKAPFALMNLRKRGVKVIPVGNMGFPDQEGEDSRPSLERMRKNYRIAGSLHLLREADEIKTMDLARQEDEHGLLMNLARRIEILY